MGLDMYLFRRTPLPDGAAKEVEVMYWRKANQIRQWFNVHLGGIENTTESPVTKENLEDLITDCCAVLNDHNLAPILMPTSRGFFFGGTEYDEWYFEDLEETVNKLIKVINEVDWDKDEVYYYEWW